MGFVGEWLSGRALAWGARGPGFDSLLPDFFVIMKDFFKRVECFLLEKRIQISSFVFVFLILHYIYEKKVPYDVLRYPGCIGTALVILGVFFRSWAAGVIIKNKKLTTYGPYCICRHPLYLGTLFIALGFCFILNDLKNMVVILFFMIFVYLPKIKREEEKLAKEFKDDWQNYYKETSKLIPNLKNINYPWSFKLWLKNKEHLTFSGCFLGLIMLKVWSSMSF